MTDDEALLAAIIADPDEDTPRLAYADWLQENGQSERAGRHGSTLSVWELADGTAARLWLTAHPDVPDPPPGAGNGQRSLVEQ